MNIFNIWLKYRWGGGHSIFKGSESATWVCVSVPWAPFLHALPNPDNPNNQHPNIFIVIPSAQPSMGLLGYTRTLLHQNIDLDLDPKKFYLSWFWFQIPEETSCRFTSLLLICRASGLLLDFNFDFDLLPLTWAVRKKGCCRIRDSPLPPQELLASAILSSKDDGSPLRCIPSPASKIKLYNDERMQEARSKALHLLQRFIIVFDRGNYNSD